MSAVTTHALRQQVLRPHQSVSEMSFPGDDDPETGHFAAIVGPDRSGLAGQGGPSGIIGIVTVLHQSPDPTRPPSPTGDPGAWWRLRCMAIVEPHRGRGVGSDLMAVALSHVAAQGGSMLWCNARLSAAGFYRQVGFAPAGDQWDEPFIGPHVVMWRAVRQP